MTKKEELMLCGTQSIEDKKSLMLGYALPYSKGETAEIITVSSKYVKDKLDYIEEMYNDDLTMKHNPQVEILYFI